MSDDKVQAALSAGRVYRRTQLLALILIFAISAIGLGLEVYTSQRLTGLAVQSRQLDQQRNSDAVRSAQRNRQVLLTIQDQEDQLRQFFINLYAAIQAGKHVPYLPLPAVPKNQALLVKGCPHGYVVLPDGTIVNVPTKSSSSCPK